MVKGLTLRTEVVVRLAAEEAYGLGHKTVEPCHILLGIVRDGEGVAAGVLLESGLDLNKLKDAISCTLSQSTPPSFSRAYDIVLTAAHHEAERCNHEYVGPEHVLLALLRIEPFPVKQVFEHLKIDPALIEMKVSYLLGIPVLFRLSHESCEHIDSLERLRILLGLATLEEAFGVALKIWRVCQTVLKSPA